VTSIAGGARIASSSLNGRSSQRQPPGSLGRRTRSHRRVPVRERSPGGLSDCQHVSAAGCLLQWLLCVDEAEAVAACSDRCGVDRRNPCGSQSNAKRTWYYCSDPAGYYPSVTHCNTVWEYGPVSAINRNVAPPRGSQVGKY